ncbi:MAG: ATP-binding cassette domain-containing protein, partial [Allobaculum sp.]|nr:ATP-binding cassette domain-containing protein [Allobaculum sp.]
PAEAKSMLNRLGISNYDQPVMQLSGGERKRIALVRTLLTNADILVLDEPTNHLDIPAKEALEKALSNYDGTLLFVSHDRMFLSKMADKVLEVGPKSQLYDFFYLEYAEKKKEGTLQLSIEPVTKKQGRGMAKVEPPKSAAVLRQEKNTLQNRVRTIEELLVQAEEDANSLEELRYEPEYYQDYRKMEELEGRIDDKKNEIAHLTKEWEEKMMRLEEM